MRAASRAARTIERHPPGRPRVHRVALRPRSNDVEAIARHPSHGEASERSPGLHPEARHAQIEERPSSEVGHVAPSRRPEDEPGAALAVPDHGVSASLHVGGRLTHETSHERADEGSLDGDGSAVPQIRLIRVRKHGELHESTWFRLRHGPWIPVGTGGVPPSPHRARSGGPRLTLPRSGSLKPGSDPDPGPDALHPPSDTHPAGITAARNAALAHAWRFSRHEPHVEAAPASADGGAAVSAMH